MIAVISHDAGGAEILSSWLLRCSESYCLVLDGPAKAIFKQKLGADKTTPLSEAIDRCDWVLCGTSWESSLEREAILSAKNAGKKVISFLDHWVNYKERFQSKATTQLPDEIWVGDTDGENLARKNFPDLPVFLKANPYFEDLQIELEKMQLAYGRDSDEYSALYVCEPIRKHARLQHGDERYWGYSEEEALEYFIKNIHGIGRKLNHIKIRPHPSEDKNKYNWVKQGSQVKVTIGSGETLLEEIAGSDVVVGCASMAMVVGLLAKKRVICSIPPSGGLCPLPQKEIEHLYILASKMKAVPNA